MKHFLIRLSVFISVLISLLLIKMGLTPYYLGNPIFDSKLKYFNENIEKYNAVAFGSSRMYRQLVPHILDTSIANFKVSTYNFGSPACFSPESYFQFENFVDQLKSNTVKYAFFEIQTLNRLTWDNSKSTRGSYWNTLSMLNYSLKYIFKSNISTKNKLNQFKIYLNSFFTNLTDFRQFKNLVIKKKLNGKNGFYSLEDKMKECTGQCKIQERFNEFQSDTLALLERITSSKKEYDILKINNVHLDFLKNLISKAEKKGILLVFVLPPRHVENDYEELIPILTALPELNVVELYKYQDFPDLYRVSNSFDIGHLNNKGATLFTKYLSEAIKQKIEQLE